MSSEVVWCCLVACLWGVTNALMKQGTSGVERIRSDSKIKQIFCEIKYLILNWKYFIPFLINQAGSILYFWILSTATLSIVVPFTNSLTLVVATLFGKALGEVTGGFYLYLGITLILVGVAISSF